MPSVIRGADDFDSLTKAITNITRGVSSGEQGSITLGDNVILKWGSINTSASAAVDFTYNTPFPNQFLAAYVSADSTGVVVSSTQLGNTNTVGVNAWDTNGIRVVSQVFVWAIGF